MNPADRQQDRESGDPKPWLLERIEFVEPEIGRTYEILDRIASAATAIDTMLKTPRFRARFHRPSRIAALATLAWTLHESGRGQEFHETINDLMALSPELAQRIITASHVRSEFPKLLGWVENAGPEQVIGFLKEKGKLYHSLFERVGEGKSFDRIVEKFSGDEEKILTATGEDIRLWQIQIHDLPVESYPQFFRGKIHAYIHGETGLGSLKDDEMTKKMGRLRSLIQLHQYEEMRTFVLDMKRRVESTMERLPDGRPNPSFERDWRSAKEMWKTIDRYVQLLKEKFANDHLAEEIDRLYKGKREFASEWVRSMDKWYAEIISPNYLLRLLVDTQKEILDLIDARRGQLISQKSESIRELKVLLRSIIHRRDHDKASRKAITMAQKAAKTDIAAIELRMNALPEGGEQAIEAANESLLRIEQTCDEIALLDRIQGDHLAYALRMRPYLAANILPAIQREGADPLAMLDYTLAAEQASASLETHRQVIQSLTSPIPKTGLVLGTDQLASVTAGLQKILDYLREIVKDHFEMVPESLETGTLEDSTVGEVSGMADAEGRAEGPEGSRTKVVYNWVKQSIAKVYSKTRIGSVVPKLYTPPERQHPLHVHYREALFQENKKRVENVRTRIEPYWDRLETPHFTDGNRKGWDYVPEKWDLDDISKENNYYNIGTYTDVDDAEEELAIAATGMNCQIWGEDIDWDTELGITPDLQEKVIQLKPLSRMHPDKNNFRNLLFDHLKSLRNEALYTFIDYVNKTILKGTNVFLSKHPIGYFYPKDPRNPAIGWVFESEPRKENNGGEEIVYVGIPQPHMSAIKHKDGRVQCYLHFGKDNLNWLSTLVDVEFARLEEILNWRVPKESETVKNNLKVLQPYFLIPFKGLHVWEDKELRPIARDTREMLAAYLASLKEIQTNYQFKWPDRYFWHRYRFVIPRKYYYVGIGKDDGQPKFVLIVPKIQCKIERGEVPINETDMNVLNAMVFPVDEPSKNANIRGALDESNMPLELTRYDDEQYSTKLGRGFFVLNDLHPWTTEYYPADVNKSPRQVKSIPTNKPSHPKNRRKVWVNEGIHGFPSIMEIVNWMEFEFDNYRDDFRDGRYHPKNTTAYEYSQLINALSTAKRHPVTKMAIDPAWMDLEGDIPPGVPEKNYNGNTVRKILKDYKIRDKNDFPSHLNPCFDWRAIRESEKYPYRHIDRKNYYDTGTFLAVDRQFDPHLSTRGIAKYIIERVIMGTTDYYKDARNLLRNNPDLGKYLDFGPGKYKQTYSWDPLGAKNTDERVSHFGGS